MDLTTDQRKPATSKTPAARCLFELKDEILRKWTNLVRERISAAAHLHHPVLVDTVPVFLNNLAEALSEEHPRSTATESNNISQEHGGERARLSRYSPDHLLREYQILRDVVLETLQDAIPLSERDRITIQRSFDDAICDSMTAFFLVHAKIREQFVAALSHDLRNPIGSAKMAGEMIILAIEENEDHRPDLCDDVRDLAQRIVRNTRRADRMIQDLLDASVLQVGEKLSLKIVECEFLSIVQEVVADQDHRVQERIQVQGNPVWGFWDREATRRAIENLISNALKYGKPATPVTVTVETKEGRLMMAVHNDGPAIPPNEQEVLFQAFRRAEAAMASGKKGWGIGLAFVRSMAEGHGGTIVVDSAPEYGTTFTIDIPVDARPFRHAPLSTGQH